MLSKQDFKKRLLSFKDWLQEQMGIFLAFFWRNMAHWMSKVAAFSQRKAGELNVSSEWQSPVSGDEIKPAVPVPASVITLLKGLREEIRNSHNSHNVLLENIVTQQADVNDNLKTL